MTWESIFISIVAQRNVSVAPRRDDSEIAPFARKIKTLKPKDDGV